MRKPGFIGSMRAAGRVVPLLLVPLIGTVQGCTDLEESPFSAITPENFYRNEEEIVGGLAAVYAEMRGTLWGYYNLSEISTDELIVPTRGQDWYDNGRWLEIHRQMWGPNTTSGLDDINGMWVNLFTGVARANVLLEALPNVSVANKAALEAEVRTLRAFYYYMLMDMFGGVPIVTTTEITTRPRNTRAEVFAFIEKELNAARPALNASWPANMHGRMTRGAADAILASMYLNAEVFTGTVNPNGLQRGAAQWQNAVAAADRVINSGVYSLATPWRRNFTSDNHLSPELILVVKHISEPWEGGNFVWRSNHYHQNPSGWNGFSTLAETYYAFDKNDKRIEIFQVGQQFDANGKPLTTRDGKPLVFVPEIKDATQAGEAEGARLVKWPFDPKDPMGGMANDYAYFRLGEIYLIKAEALNELGQTAQALQIVNMLRQRVGAKPLSTSLSKDAARSAILQERLFELTGESKRRQDLIRHNRFTLPWAFKDQREAYRVLMPIPQTQIDANPQLQQNPGY